MNKRTWWRRCYAWFIENHVFWALFVVLAAKFLPPMTLPNEIDTLSYAKHFFNPDWLENDWYLSRSIPYRTLFNLIIGPITAFFSLTSTALIGRTLLCVMFAFLFQKLGRWLSIRGFLLTLGVALFIDHQSLTAGEWMIGGLETKPFAYFFCLLSLFLLSEKRFRLGFACLGVAFSFHILVGAHTAFCLLVAAAINRKIFKGDLKVIIRNIWPMIVCSSFGLLAVVSDWYHDSGLNSESAALIRTFYRDPHHVLPSAWPQFWEFKVIGAASVATGALLFTRHKSLRMLSAFSAASSLLFMVGLAIYQAGFPRFLKFYWFRFADTILPFSILLLSCRLIGWIVEEKIMWFRFRKPTTVFLGILFAGYVLFSTQRLTAGIWNRRYVLSRPDMGGALRWIRMNTEKDSVILNDAFISDFYLAADRAQFIGFKHVPQYNDDIVEWHDRLKSCNGGTSPLSKGFSLKKEIVKNFNTLSPSYLKDLANRDYLDYYLGENRPLPGLSRVYVDASYAVYSLKDKSIDTK